VGERGSGAFRFEWPILESTACYIQRWVLTCFILAAVAAAHHSTPCLCVFHSCSCRCCVCFILAAVAAAHHSTPCPCVCVPFLQLSLLLTTQHPTRVCSILAAVAAAHHSTPCLCVFHFCSCRCCSPLNTLPFFVSFLQLSLLLTTQHPTRVCVPFLQLSLLLTT